MSTKMPCPLPLMGDNCTETYAQHAPQTYQVYQGIYIPLAVILLITSTIQNIRLWRIRGVKWRDYYTSVIHQLFALTFISSVTLTIRAVDPQGWANKLPPALYDLCEETGTSAAYSMVPVCIFNWIKIIRSIYGRPPEPVYRATCVIVVVWYVWTMIMTVLHAWFSPSYVYQNAIDSMNVVMNIIVMAAGWFYGYRIYGHLSKYGNQPVSASHSISKPSTSKPSTSTPPSALGVAAETVTAPSSPSPSPSPAPSAAPTPSSSIAIGIVPSPATATATATAVGTATLTVPGQSSTSPSPVTPRTTARRAGVRVTFHILISFTFVSLVAILLQIYDIVNNFEAQYDSALYPFDHYPSFDPADTFARYAAVPFCHAGATIIVLVFYRKLGSRPNSHVSPAPSSVQMVTPNKPKGGLLSPRLGMTPTPHTRTITNTFVTPTHTRTTTHPMAISPQQQPLHTLCEDTATATATAATGTAADEEAASIRTQQAQPQQQSEPEPEQSSRAHPSKHIPHHEPQWSDVPSLLINNINIDVDGDVIVVVDASSRAHPDPVPAVLLDIVSDPISSPGQTTRALLSPADGSEQVHEDDQDHDHDHQHEHAHACAHPHAVNMDSDHECESD